MTGQDTSIRWTAPNQLLIQHHRRLEGYFTLFLSFVWLVFGLAPYYLAVLAAHWAWTLLVSLLFLTGLIVNLAFVFWNLGGKEILEFHEDEITYRRQFLFVKTVRSIPRTRILSVEPLDDFELLTIWASKCRLRFVAGEYTQRFADRIAPEQAKILRSELSRRLRQRMGPA